MIAIIGDRELKFPASLRGEKGSSMDAEWLDQVSVNLREQFSSDSIRQRQGPGGKSFSYISGADVITRVIDATSNRYDFRILDIKNMGSFFLATVELEIPGLGKRQGIGVQANIEANEDAIKGAITDGFKLAAKMFGVGLGLWTDAPHQNSGSQSFSNQAPAQQQQQAGGLMVREPSSPASEKQIYKIRAMVAERGGNPQLIDSMSISKGKAHEYIEQMMGGNLPPDLFQSKNQPPAEVSFADNIKRILQQPDGIDQFQNQLAMVKRNAAKPNADQARTVGLLTDLANNAPTTEFLDEIYDFTIDTGLSVPGLATAITTRFDALMSRGDGF